MSANKDDTEDIRRTRLATNGAVQSLDPVAERKRLEHEHRKVWDAAQLAADFEVLGFMAHYVIVQCRSDAVKASLEPSGDAKGGAILYHHGETTITR